jgi:hypothetical protein
MRILFRFSFAGLAALLLGLTGCVTRTVTHKEYPVRVVGTVHWPAGQTVEQLKDTPMSEFGPGDLEAINMTDGTNTVTVQTWREFRHYSDQRYTFVNNLDFKFSSYFIEERGFIRFLERAIPSRHSGVGSLRMNRRLLWQLPLDLGMTISNTDLEELEAAERAGLSWTQRWPETRLCKTEPNSMLLVTESSMAQLRVVAYGDYDNDGWEDVMVQVSHQARGGTLGYSFNALLTRTPPDGRLRRIEW